MTPGAADGERGPVLITGASGFLGKHVLSALRRRRPELRVLALLRERAGRDAPRELPAGVETLAGSLDAPEAWLGSPALRALGGILHLGARVEHRRSQAAAIERTNVEGTRALVELAAARGCRIVVLSTSGTVGCFRDPHSAAREGDPFCEERVKRWPYYASKIRAERVACASAARGGAELVILRPPILLGPGDDRFRSTAHLLRLLQGRLPFLIRGGIHYTDVRDVAEATVSALERPGVRPLYHLPGTACSTQEFFALSAELAGIAPPRFTLPFALAWSAACANAWIAAALPRESLRWLPDPVVIEMGHHYWGLASSWAGAELGFAPRDARETLRDTIAWLRAHHPALVDGGAGRRGADPVPGFAPTQGCEEVVSAAPND